MFDAILSLLSRTVDQYLGGLLVTMQLAGLSTALALTIGVLAAIAWRSKSRLVRAPITAYVELFRNTPLILQIVYAYFALPELGLRLTGFQAGVLALALNGGAYLTVVISAGIRAVHPGQLQAATALSLSKRATFLHIVLPQAVRYVYPPIINQFVLMIHGTSIMSVIAVQEITGVTGVINSQTFQTVEAFTIAAVLYVLLINGVGLLSEIVAKLVFRPPLESSKMRISFARGLMGFIRRTPVPASIESEKTK